MSDEEYSGVDQALAAFGDVYRLYPKIKLAAGDRAHFYSLTSGKDKWFGGARFHEWGSGNDFRRKVCVASLGDGTCTYCETENIGTVKRQFALWIYMESIYHVSDNPDDGKPGWPQVKTKEGRILYREDIGQAQLLQLGVGWKRSWFNMFQNAIGAYGTLQHHKWQLLRRGTGRDDTEYILSAIKAEPTPPEIAALAKDLASVYDVFRETVVTTKPVPLGLVQTPGDEEEYSEISEQNMGVLEEGDTFEGL